MAASGAPGRAGLVWLTAWVAVGVSAGSLCAAQGARAAGGEAVGDAVMILNRAMVQYNAEDYEGCIGVLTELLDARPETTEARFLRALAYGQLAWPEEDRDPAAAAKLYTRMHQDIDRLVKEVAHEYAVQLINAVVLTKLAGYAEGAHAERVAARKSLLTQARRSLETYLNPPPGSGIAKPTGMRRVRGEWFLAVVTYRLALTPAAKAGQPDVLADRAVLDEAAEMMVNLANRRRLEGLLPRAMPDRARSRELNRWLSYPEFYLGLIHTRQGNHEAARRNYAPAKDRWQEATHHFSEAKTLDLWEGESLSVNLIPSVADQQIEDIQTAVASLVKAPPPTENLTIQWRSGLAYDTNVILLGHDTKAPLDIGRKRDVRFATGVMLGYTLDLAKVDPSLDRLSLGVLGRASSSWHGDIHSFNEQDYGSTVGLSYELWRPPRDSRHGPLYGAIQYDYDYFLLGNDGFLRTNRVGPRLTLYTFDQRAVTSLGFSYEDRNYLEPLRDLRFDRDGNYFSLNLSQWVDLVDMTRVYKDLGLVPWGLAHDPADPARLDAGDPEVLDTRDYRRWLSPYLGVTYGWDATKGEEFDADWFLLSAGFKLPLPYGLMFDFGGEWEWQNYKGGSLVDYHREGRDDFIQRYGFGLERRFVLVPGRRAHRTTLTVDRATMTVRGEIRFADDHANTEDRLGQSIFAYDRAIYGLSVLFELD